MQIEQYLKNNDNKNYNTIKTLHKQELTAFSLYYINKKENQ